MKDYAAARLRALSAIADALAPADATAILDRYPMLRDAGDLVADVLDILDDSDAYLEFIEPFFNQGDFAVILVALKDAGSDHEDAHALGVMALLARVILDQAIPDPAAVRALAFAAREEVDA